MEKTPLITNSTPSIGNTVESSHDGTAGLVCLFPCKPTSGLRQPGYRRHVQMNKEPQRIVCPNCRVEQVCVVHSDARIMGLISGRRTLRIIANRWSSRGQITYMDHVWIQRGSISTWSNSKVYSGPRYACNVNFFTLIVMLEYY